MNSISIGDNEAIDSPLYTNETQPTLETSFSIGIILNMVVRDFFGKDSY